MGNPNGHAAAKTRRMPSMPVVPMAILIPLALWLAVTPFVGTALGFVLTVPVRLEIIDHVVPGVVAAGAAAVALAWRHRPAAPTVFLVSGGLSALAGLWALSTHVPLLAQASQGMVPWTTALFHTVPGPVVMVAALLALVPAYRAAD